MSNQVALITGAASGIGKAAALKLAARGTTVVISGRRQDLGHDAVAEISAVATSGAQVRFIRNDVTDEHAVKSMIDSIVAEFGRLDMAVNNAGISNETATLVQSSSEKYRAMLDTNVLGLYFCMKYEIAQMLTQGRGLDCQFGVDCRIERYSVDRTVCVDEACGHGADQVFRP